MRFAGSLLLIACAPPPNEGETYPCALPPVEAGRARVRPLLCAQDRVSGGEGRTGDWILENALARFVIRAPEAGALTALAEDGGSLVDAVRLGVEEGVVVQRSADVLVELRPHGDRSRVLPLETPEGAGLELPGFSWWLPPDSLALEILGGAGAPPDATLIWQADPARADASARRDGGFLGVDGHASGEGWRTVSGLTHVGLTWEATWPEAMPFDFTPEADTPIEALRDGSVLARWAPEELPEPDAEGRRTLPLPEGATLRGVDPACAFERLDRAGCFSLRLRVVDENDDDLAAEVRVGDRRWTLPPGGGTVALGPSELPRTVWVWAGPAHDAVRLELPAGETGERSTNVRLRSAFPHASASLARFDVLAAPDAATEASPRETRDALLGTHVDFAVFGARDEVVPNPGSGPAWSSAPVQVRAGSWTAGQILSWPWSPNPRARAHGAVPWKQPHGTLGALDQLAWAEGGDGLARRTMVTADWIAQARGEAPPAAWAPRPDSLLLRAAEDVDTWRDLLAEGMALAPAGPWTWLWPQGERSPIAMDQALVAQRSCAGTGPRLRLEPRSSPRRDLLRLTVEAPAWARVSEARLIRPDGGALRVPLETPFVDGLWTTEIPWPKDSAWVALEVRGARAWPWSPADGSDPAWALSAPVVR